MISNEVYIMEDYSDGTSYNILIIKVKLVYILGKNKPIGNIVDNKAGSYMIELLNVNNYEQFYNFLIGIDSSITEDDAKKYFEFDGALISDDRIAIPNSGQVDVAS